MLTTLLMQTTDHWKLQQLAGLPQTLHTTYDEDVAAGEEVLAGEVDEDLSNLPVVPAAIPEESEYVSLVMRLNERAAIVFLRDGVL